MSELQELYQEVILDHKRNPRNFRKLEGVKHSAQGYNPFCGDEITLYLKIEDDKVADVGFQGTGCAISTASASMMTQSIKGMSLEEVERIFHKFHDMVTRPPGSDFESDELGDLEILSGVTEFPTRVKCASLSWHTLHAALASKGEPVSIEVE